MAEVKVIKIEEHSEFSVHAQMHVTLLTPSPGAKQGCWPMIMFEWPYLG